jgi:CelD/BcsL family acetyltransferase involved in cellulose biosynthesis
MPTSWPRLDRMRRRSGTPRGRPRWGLGDVLVLRHVRPGSLLDRVARATRRPATRDAILAPWICFEQFPDFDAYLAGVNKDRLVTLRRLRRGLARKGALESAVLDDPASRAEAVDWVLARKQEWLAREGLRSAWVGTAGYHAFLHRMAGMSGASAPLRIFVLRLDGKLIAVFVCSTNRNWLEFHLNSHDPAWAHFSPGTLLMTDCIAWAHAHGLRFDFRIGDERYKASWANRSCDVTTFHVALTARGMVAVGMEAARLGGLRARSRYRRAQARIIRHLPRSWREQLKTVLVRCASRFARVTP